MHINVEGSAADFLVGQTRQEGLEILIATFAKAVVDLSLDIVVVVEHQPRPGEANRLGQLRDALGDPWASDESEIPYPPPFSSFGHLQFGILWKTTRVTIDPTQDQVLLQLRQGSRLRAPWLVPVTAGQLEFDLIVLHLKSGGSSPQGDEVDALEAFIRSRQTQPSPRHLIVLGDWNTRPDKSQGRNRLRQLAVPLGSINLMRVLTVEEIAPSLSQWEALSPLSFGDASASLVPFTHFNTSSIDTFLDHIAISRTLEEIFDSPIQVTLESGTSDVRPGIRIAYPIVSEQTYLRLTDHLPVVMTLRTTSNESLPSPVDNLFVEAALPNPFGEDGQNEEVHLRNPTDQAIPLSGWRVGDATGTRFWNLTDSDGTVQPGGLVIVRRTGRSMALNNSGDRITLTDPGGSEVDRKEYGATASGLLVRFQ